MRFIKNKKWLGFTLGIGMGIASGEAYSTDLMSVYQLAIENDRTFSASNNTFNAIKQSQRQVKGLYYPTFEVAVEHTETDQEINRSDNEVFGSGQSDFPTDVLTLSLTQPLFRWDYINQRRVAKAEVRQAEFQHIASEQELMLRSAEAYLLSLAAKDNEFVTNAELEAVGEQVKMAKKRLEVGLADPTEVHESEARFQLNQSEVIEAENAVIDQLEGLNTITGEFLSDLIPLKESFEMPPPDPTDPEMWIAQAEANNLAVKALEAAVEVAMAEYKSQKSGRYPTVDLVANFNNRDTGGSLFGGGSDVDTNDVTVRAAWTVFQGGSLRARIKEAMYTLQRAQDDLELGKRNVRRETRNAYLGVVSSIAKANALDAALKSQEITVKAKQKGFETGANSNLEVLDAKRDFFFVQRDFLNARYDYLMSMLNLKRQTGSLSPEDLGVVNGMLQVATIDSVSELEVAQSVSIPKSVINAGPGNNDVAADVADEASDSEIAEESPLLVVDEVMVERNAINRGINSADRLNVAFADSDWTGSYISVDKVPSDISTHEAVALVEDAIVVVEKIELADGGQILPTQLSVQSDFDTAVDYAARLIEQGDVEMSIEPAFTTGLSISTYDRQFPSVVGFVDSPVINPDRASKTSKKMQEDNLECPWI